MSLVLTVDGERWRRHLLDVADHRPGLVPVVKGNGYGFGPGRLARRTQWLADRGAGGDTLAVGTYEELPAVRSRFHGDLLVMTPWRSFLPAPAGDPRVVHTVGRLDDLAALLASDPTARFVLERMTSMRRHGLSARELRRAGGLLRGSAGEPPADHRGARLAGVALHLPLQAGSHLAEVERLVTDVVAAGLPTGTIWVSHLTGDELAQLRRRHPDHTWRPRVGTALWLGDREALRPHARVLDVHPVSRGDTFGYRGRSVPRAGHLVVVSGGTAHGIGLEAPAGHPSLRSRAASLARGGLDAAGFVRSPYWIGGKQRLFAEPPHMQASMLFLPDGAPVPEVGDEVDVRVRFTTTSFDRVVID